MVFSAAARVFARSTLLLPSLAAALAILTAAALAGSCGSPQTSTVLSPSAARCALRIDRDSAAFPPAGGSGALAVAVDRECPWTAKADASWVTLTGNQGHGDGSVQFTVAANAAPSARTAGVLVNDRRLAIVQEGQPCEFELSSDRESVPAAGGRLTIGVRATAGECAWTAREDEPWLSIVSGRDGRGDGAVVVQVAPAEGLTRTGRLTIAGETVRVVQTAAPNPVPPSCRFSLSATTLTEPASGGTTALNVDTASDCPWTAVAEHAWITVTGSGATGTGQVRVTVGANPGPARTGSIVIAGQRVTVSQASGCTYTLTPPSQQSPPHGGNAPVAIATHEGCAWTAASPVDWIMVARAGTGPGPVTVTVASNSGPPRRGTLSIAGQPHTIEQASSCSWSFSPPYHEYGAGGGFGTVLVLVVGSCSWTSASTVDWIHVVAGSSGRGEGMVQFTVAPNAGRSRTGAVLIAGERYLVNQAGQ